MIGNRIKNRRKELNMTQQELANLTSFKTKGAISRIENNLRDINQSQIVEIAKALQTSPSYLMGWEDNLHPYIGIIQKSKPIPILGDIACGDPIWATQNYDGHFALDQSIQADFILKAKGDSMIEVGINEGDKCFIRKMDFIETDGKIYVVLLDDSATLKRVYHTDNGYILQPENKSHKPRFIEGDLRVLGELVGVYKEYK